MTKSLRIDARIDLRGTYPVRIVNLQKRTITIFSANGVEEISFNDIMSLRIYCEHIPIVIYKK